MEGLHASLDKLVHHRENRKWKALIYTPSFISSVFLIFDRSRPLGRKWVLANDDGTKTVVEGEKIVGESPVIPPGEISRIIAIMLPIFQQKLGSFHGVDEFQNRIHINMKPIRLNILVTKTILPFMKFTDLNAHGGIGANCSLVNSI